MKAETALRISIECMRVWHFNYLNNVLASVRDAAFAPTIPSYMAAKKQLLATVLDLPLGHRCCPYCNLWEGNCKDCDYAARYGPCSDKDSAYQKIQSSLSQFHGALEDYWRTDKIPELKAGQKLKDFVLSETRSSLIEWYGDFNRDISQPMAHLLRAETIHDFMHLKQLLMLTIVSDIPLQISYCPFCTLHYPKCNECEYGKLYGICNAENSTFARLVQAKFRLLDALRSYW